MIGPLLGLSLLGAPPVFVDDRADIPWIVVAAPGSRCGSLRLLEGPRSERDRLVATVSQQPEQQMTSKTTTTPAPAVRLPLLPGPGLLGEEGELLLVVVEHLLAQSGVGGPVTLRIDAQGAWLGLPRLKPDDAAVVAAAAVPPADLQLLQERARARVARRRATIGAWAGERAQRWACFAVVDDPAVPLDVGRRLRARLSALAG